MLAALFCEKRVGGVEHGFEVEPEGVVEGDDGLAAGQPVIVEGLFFLEGEVGGLGLLGGRWAVRHGDDGAAAREKVGERGLVGLVWGCGCVDLAMFHCYLVAGRSW